MKKKYHSTGAVIFATFIAAAVCVTAIVFIIFQSGLRYMKTTTGIKYFGNVDKSENITNGRLWFEDSVATIKLQKFYTVEITVATTEMTNNTTDNVNLSETLKILNITSADNALKVINDALPKEITDVFPMNNFIFNTSDIEMLFHKETFDSVIKNYEISENKNIIKSGEIYTSDGRKWILSSTKTHPSSYEDFEVTQESDRTKIYRGDVLKFIDDEQITFASFTLTEGNIINLYPAYNIYRLYYEKGSHTDDLYIGTLNDNLEKNGAGLYYYTKTGDIYYGDFDRDKKTGYCEWLFAQGDTYIGHIDDGKMEGEGIFRWSDGTSYSGTFKDNMKNGYGVNVFNDGSIYEGSYVNDAKQGKGKYTWANGDVYEGDFVSDLYKGKGKYTWASGEYYEGDFMHNSMHGWGTYYWTSGRTYEGWFSEGKMVLEKPDDIADESGESTETDGIEAIEETQ